MEKEKLSKCLSTLKISNEWLDILHKSLNDYGITKDYDVKMFLAQTSHESMNYSRLEESFKYKPETLLKIFKKYIKDIEDAKQLLSQGAEAVANRVYGGRLGNAKNEGYKYRGRGIIQLTGKTNYLNYSKLVGADLVKNPDLAKNKDIAIQIACCYYVNRGCLGKSIKDCTKLINGGLNGLEDREKRFNMLEVI